MPHTDPDETVPASSTTARYSDRYYALIDATLRQALAAYTFTPPAKGTIAVAAALPAVAKRLGVTMREDTCAAIDAHLASARDDAPFVDGQGHTRPTYRPLALRAMTRSHPAVGTASSEPDLVRDAFDALLLADADADRFFRVLIEKQQPRGTFLSSTSSVNLEPLWYDELALLHALAVYACRRPETTLAAAVERSVLYHAAEVQPDHASSHPWALAAFLAYPDGVPLADMMLHAAGVQQPTTMDAVSLLLLADASDCGRSRR